MYLIQYLIKNYSGWRKTKVLLKTNALAPIEAASFCALVSLTRA